MYFRVTIDDDVTVGPCTMPNNTKVILHTTPDYKLSFYSSQGFDFEYPLTIHSNPDDLTIFLVDWAEYAELVFSEIDDDGNQVETSFIWEKENDEDTLGEDLLKIIESNPQLKKRFTISI